MIVGIAGKKQTGKSTVASKLCQHGFREVSLADPIKRAARVILEDLGVSWSDVWKAEIDKEAIIDRLGQSYRVMLQTLGTEWGRGLNPDIWLNCAAHKLTQLEGCDVVFSDVRFENEAALIRAHGGLVVHLVRSTCADDTHVSEAGIKIHPSDVVITNNNTLDALFKHVAAVLDSHVLHIKGQRERL